MEGYIRGEYLVQGEGSRVRVGGLKETEGRVSQERVFGGGSTSERG